MMEAIAWCSIMGLRVPLCSLATGASLPSSANLVTQTLQFPFRAVRISTAWGQPNVLSVPIQALKDFIPAKE